MREKQYIYITGCAKSGTTLLARMFYSFEDVYICNTSNIDQHELSLYGFLKSNANTKFIIGKRIAQTIFSNSINAKKLEGQISKIKKHKVNIINIIRDGRDVIQSSSGYAGPRRWISSMEQSREYGDIIKLQIKYEDLIRNPDKIQKEISVKFGLKIKDLFSDYPDFLPKEYTNTKEVNYSIRKISNNSISKKRELSFYKNKFFKNKKDLFLKFKKELIFANYL